MVQNVTAIYNGEEFTIDISAATGWSKIGLGKLLAVYTKDNNDLVSGNLTKKLKMLIASLEDDGENPARTILESGNDFAIQYFLEHADLDAFIFTEVQDNRDLFLGYAIAKNNIDLAMRVVGLGGIIRIDQFKRLQEQVASSTKTNGHWEKARDRLLNDYRIFFKSFVADPLNTYEVERKVQIEEATQNNSRTAREIKDLHEAVKSKITLLNPVVAPQAAAGELHILRGDDDSDVEMAGEQATVRAAEPVTKPSAYRTGLASSLKLLSKGNTQRLKEVVDTQISKQPDIYRILEVLLNSNKTWIINAIPTLEVFTKVLNDPIPPHMGMPLHIAIKNTRQIETLMAFVRAGAILTHANLELATTKNPYRFNEDYISELKNILDQEISLVKLAISKNENLSLLEVDQRLKLDSLMSSTCAADYVTLLADRENLLVKLNTQLHARKKLASALNEVSAVSVPSYDGTEEESIADQPEQTVRTNFCSRGFVGEIRGLQQNQIAEFQKIVNAEIEKGADHSIILKVVIGTKSPWKLSAVLQLEGFKKLLNRDDIRPLDAVLRWKVIPGPMRVLVEAGAVLTNAHLDIMQKKKSTIGRLTGELTAVFLGDIALIEKSTRQELEGPDLARLNLLKSVTKIVDHNLLLVDRKKLHEGFSEMSCMDEHGYQYKRTKTQLATIASGSFESGAAGAPTMPKDSYTFLRIYRKIVKENAENAKQELFKYLADHPFTLIRRLIYRNLLDEIRMISEREDGPKLMNLKQRCEKTKKMLTFMDVYHPMRERGMIALIVAGTVATHKHMVYICDQLHVTHQTEDIRNLPKKLKMDVTLIERKNNSETLTEADATRIEIMHEVTGISNITDLLNDRKEVLSMFQRKLRSASEDVTNNLLKKRTEKPEILEDDFDDRDVTSSAAGDVTSKKGQPETEEVSMETTTVSADTQSVVGSEITETDSDIAKPSKKPSKKPRIDSDHIIDNIASVWNYPSGDWRSIARRAAGEVVNAETGWAERVSSSDSDTERRK